MHSEMLQLTQHPATKKQPAYVEMKASDNVVLDGRSFHALAQTVTYDESKGLYILSGIGKRNATIWYEKTIGTERSSVSAPRMKFIPAINHLEIDHAAGGQAIR